MKKFPKLYLSGDKSHAKRLFAQSSRLKVALSCITVTIRNMVTVQLPTGARS